MPKLTPLALRHLLPLVEETLAPLLPVKVQIKTPPEPPLVLKHRGEAVASLEIEAKGLSEEELKRWRYALLALAQEIFDRLTREKTVAGYPGPGLLAKALEKGPQEGLLIHGLVGNEGFSLSPEVFFIPEAGPEFLKELWRRGEKFVAVSVRFESPEEVEGALPLLELAEILGFSWLSGKAAQYLRDLGITEEMVPELRAFLALNREGRTLTIAEGPGPSLNCLRGRAEISLFLGKTRALFALDLDLEETKELLSDLHLRAGFLESSHREEALASVWAAFEHARRLPEETAVPFQPLSEHVLGDLYFDLGDLGAAKRAYLFALQGTPQLVDLLNSLAVIMIRLKDRAAACFFLLQATKEDPQDPLLHYNLALFLEEEKSPEALDYFRRAHQLAPQERIYAEALAERLVSQKAWKEIREVLGRVSLSAKGRYLLGKALYEEGRLEEAMCLFKKTLDEDPRHELALAHLALLFIQLKGEYSLAEALLPEIEGAQGELGLLAEDLKTLLRVKT